MALVNYTIQNWQGFIQTRSNALVAVIGILTHRFDSSFNKFFVWNDEDDKLCMRAADAARCDIKPGRARQLQHVTRYPGQVSARACVCLFCYYVLDRARPKSR